MDYKNILKDIDNKKYKPIYFLHGLEPYFIDKISKYIETHVLTEEEQDFNQTLMYGKEVDVHQLMNTVKQYPMGAERQVVIIREAQDIKKIELLEPYFANPVASTLLVLAYKHKKVDKRKKFYTALKKTALIFESNPLYDNQIPAFISKYIKEKGYSITPKGISLIHEFVGNNLSKVANEIDKMLINFPTPKEITEEDIENNIGISKDYNVFELQNALGKKDVLKVNKIINYFAANKKDFPMIKVVNSLFYYFQKLFKYHFLENKTNQQAIASALGVSPYFVNDYIDASKRYNPKKLSKVMSLLQEFDLKSKGYKNESSSDEDLIKELIFKIIH